jgi:aspartate kinase
MNVVVQKYGGSSVADLARIGLVADRVVAAKRAGYDVCVVVSAMGKTTDQLLAMARQASASPPRRELDMLLSVGERTTMALLAIALHARGDDAISFTGSQSGIITNDRHFDARIIEVRPFRIEDELSRGRTVIVAGYQGMSYRREITTLGRGGSDTTAVALAAALGAERCKRWPRAAPRCSTPRPWPSRSGSASQSTRAARATPPTPRRRPWCATTRPATPSASAPWWATTRWPGSKGPR